MIQKSFDTIVKPDIDALLDNSVREGRTIDYKLKLPGNSDGDKKELLADVSSFANAAGGDLLFGIAEAEGVPSDILGLADVDIDAEILRLENIIRTGIEPRIPAVQIRPIEDFQQGPVLLRSDSQELGFAAHGHLQRDFPFLQQEQCRQVPVGRF